MNLNLGDTQLIIRECEKFGCSLEQAAYILGTAYWETNKTMKPVREAYWLSESWREANLRYWPYYGRGYVQLTWDYNYKKASDKLGVNFVLNPDLVMEKGHSAKILVTGCMQGWFTGKSIPNYINENKKDYINARRVVNGTDKAITIAQIATQYEDPLKKSSYGKPKNIFVSLFNAIMEFLNARKSKN